MTSDGPKKFDTHPTMPRFDTNTLVSTDERERFLDTLLAEEAAQFAMARERPTLVSCPACHACETCHGEHMVTPERAAAYRVVEAGLETTDEP